jgi:hypothetical protein
MHARDERTLTKPSFRYTSLSWRHGQGLAQAAVSLCASLGAAPVSTIPSQRTQSPVRKDRSTGRSPWPTTFSPAHTPLSDSPHPPSLSLSSILSRLLHRQNQGRLHSNA